MKQGRLPRGIMADALNLAIEAVGDIVATGSELERLNTVYEALIDAREHVGLSATELSELKAYGLA